MHLRTLFPTNIILLLVLVIVTIGIDQLSKYFILRYFPDLAIFNPQGTWGILPPWVGLLGLVGLSIFAWGQHHMTPTLSIILAAGISNFIDRLLYGAVVDFIHIGQFPVFNLADSMVSIGAVVLIFQEFRYNHKPNI